MRTLDFLADQLNVEAFLWLLSADKSTAEYYQLLVLLYPS